MIILLATFFSPLSYKYTPFPSSLYQERIGGYVWIFFLKSIYLIIINYCPHPPFFFSFFEHKNLKSVYLLYQISDILSLLATLLASTTTQDKSFILLILKNGSFIFCVGIFFLNLFLPLPHHHHHTPHTTLTHIIISFQLSN
eukprot:UN00697